MPFLITVSVTLCGMIGVIAVIRSSRILFKMTGKIFDKVEDKLGL